MARITSDCDATCPVADATCPVAHQLALITSDRISGADGRLRPGLPDLRAVALQRGNVLGGRCRECSLPCMHDVTPHSRRCVARTCAHPEFKVSTLRLQLLNAPLLIHLSAPLMLGRPRARGPGPGLRRRRAGAPSRRREFCHAAAPPSPISWRFNRDREGVSSK